MAKGNSWEDRAMGRRAAPTAAPCCHISGGFAHIFAGTQERMEQQREVSGVELQKFSSSEEHFEAKK